MSFETLGLAKPLLRAVREAGYETPTPIQTQAIPSAIAGRDILGCAQTGTGKTAAFSLPILQRLDADPPDEPRIRALIVSPTRELAAQIGANIGSYAKHLELWHTVIFGGVKDKPQIAELRRGVDVLVATPGRLLDLMGRGHIDLKRVEVFVLDEADQMLDMGFLPDIRRIVKALPSKRQTLFFSATMPSAIKELAATLLDDPVEVAVARVSEPADVDQRLYFVDKGNKRKLLVDLLRADPSVSRSLVFSRTKHGANRIAKHLSAAGVSSAAIHGNKSQNARTRALEAFKGGELRVLVATDIAARGLDISKVSHVINFDLPNVPETYIHRIGRTARAGNSGIALSFCDVEERAYLVDIERLLRAHIERIEDHGYPPSQALPELTDLAARRSGSKPGGGAKKKSGANKSSGRRGGRGGGGRRGGKRGGGGGPRGQASRS
ncbi:putative ATP-dependent RNA helicase RhlE [Plesiocystis pacifica SIR-1]|uniref:DEAD-box ATP-dependent RNA helicase RhpA n=1 Tax=Plesiocystis pacifica SIR-1 TaxID=391625 RepID=A6FZH1_9BACT|nr:DEAD/DEAH box helicase [Plesiocystis pacifica]EDM81055.1 putative ATP-dependent RNA helicase RhlE [Plesiocystis pacifica SIR-1]